MDEDSTRRNAARRDALASRVSKLQTFVASSLIASLALFLVLEQQIRDFAAQMARFAIIRRHASIRLEETAKSLRFIAHQIDQQIEKTSKDVREKTRTETRDALTAKLTRGKRRLTADEVNEIEEEAKDAAKKRVKEFDESSGLTAADRAMLSSAFRNPPAGDALSRIDEASKGLASSSNKVKRYADSYALLADFRRVMERYLAERTAMQQANKDLIAVRSTKQALSTPLGQFDLPPRLALLYLAFAVAAAYLVFVSSAERTLALAQTVGRTGGLAVVGPAWLYSADRRTRTALEGESTQSAYALHASWLSLIVLVSGEALRWRGYASSRLAPSILSIAGLIAIDAWAVVRAWSYFHARDTVSSWRIDRRTALRLVLSGFFAVVATGIRQSPARNTRRRSSGRMHAPDTDHWDFVQNEKTFVVHHFKRCSKHLPKRPHWRSRFLTHTWVHHGAEGGILYDAAIDIHRTLALHQRGTPKVRTLTSEDAAGAELIYRVSIQEQPERLKQVIAMLEQAIEFEPLSVHLYDKLIKCYGRVKRYEDIHAVLARGIERTRQEHRRDPRSREVARAMITLEKRAQQAVARGNRRHQGPL